ncbi:MAG: glutathione S-transferase [Burkholderiales bacterium PBB4]|nr:MAG: glutathione S-transferase [Burkholderiales bacterium PBB4]
MAPPDTGHPVNLPVLYSFRRCPYAMRARLALLHSGITVELREVVLRSKPEAMLAISPKGTVPVLQLPDGKVLEQSLDIMHWALHQRGDHSWESQSPHETTAHQDWIAQCDSTFKNHLDRYKYPHRFQLADGAHDRTLGSAFLEELNSVLARQTFLGGNSWRRVDAAIAPFVRQWAHTDLHWWQAQAWSALHGWLEGFENSAAFTSIMAKFEPWVPGCPPVLWPGTLDCSTSREVPTSAM